MKMKNVAIIVVGESENQSDFSYPKGYTPYYHYLKEYVASRDVINRIDIYNRDTSIDKIKVITNTPKHDYNQSFYDNAIIPLKRLEKTI